MPMLNSKHARWRKIAIHIEKSDSNRPMIIITEEFEPRADIYLAKNYILNKYLIVYKRESITRVITNVEWERRATNQL